MGGREGEGIGEGRGGRGSCNWQQSSMKSKRLYFLLLLLLLLLVLLPPLFISELSLSSLSSSGWNENDILIQQSRSSL
jgi:hypothetical protein